MKLIELKNFLDWAFQWSVDPHREIPVKYDTKYMQDITTEVYSKRAYIEWRERNEEKSE